MVTSATSTPNSLPCGLYRLPSFFTCTARAGQPAHARARAPPRAESRQSPHRELGHFEADVAAGIEAERVQRDQAAAVALDGEVLLQPPRLAREQRQHSGAEHHPRRSHRSDRRHQLAVLARGQCVGQPLRSVRRLRPARRCLLPNLNV
eukprot:COSAG04_NODE_3333_length_2920_cov_1.732719_2_plen_149_part_00